ncbi:MAG: 2OG-Fe(II) oxygenase, partial [Allopontixanthobacter sediminis]
SDTRNTKELKGWNGDVPALFLFHILWHCYLMDLHRRVLRLSDSGQLHEAMSLLVKAVEEGNGAAAFLLANWRFEGTRIRRDLAEARRLFHRSHELNFSPSEAPLMALLASGAGGLSRDWKGALKLLEMKAEQDFRSMRQLKLISAMALTSNGEPVKAWPHDVISGDPLIVRFDEFLTGDECDELIAMARPSFTPSMVVHPGSGKLVNDKIRTSLATAFPLLKENPFLHAINRRIASASCSQWEQGEPTQILRYDEGQEYKLHSDALRGGNQRIQTFLIYLNDDFGGGETYFPHGEHYLRLPKGHAICFSNVSSDMRPANSAIHAGLPVTHGQKIVLSKWIRRQALDLSGPIGMPF